MDSVISFLKKIDWILITLPILFGLLSIMMIDSITQGYGDYPKQVVVQITSFIIGYAVMILFTIFDYNVLERFEIPLYIFSILFQLLVFVPGVGITKYGSSAWINLFGITTMQPSELIKITFVIVMASFLKRHKDSLLTFRGFCFAVLYAAPIIGLVAYIDLGAGIVMGFMFVGLIFTAGLKMGLFLRIAGVFVLSIPVIYRFMEPHQKARFAAFIHPDDMSIVATYQVFQSKIAIGSGGIFGKGLYNGTIKESGFLPVQESDFIFSIICEELGFIGGVAVILLYGILIFRIWRTIVNSKEIYGALMVVGFMCLFGFQIFENIGMTMGLMPVTGITLPFISAGGSSIVANMMALGIIGSISVRSKIRTYKNITG